MRVRWSCADGRAGRDRDDHDRLRRDAGLRASRDVGPGGRPDRADIPERLEPAAQPDLHVRVDRRDPDDRRTRHLGSAGAVASGVRLLSDSCARSTMGWPARWSSSRPRRRRSARSSDRGPRPATMPSSATSSVSSVTSVQCSPSVARPQVRREAVPELAAPGDRHVDRVHPEQGDAAQDEREDGRLELRRRRRCRDAATAAPGPQGPQHVRQRRRRRPRRRPRPIVPIRAACPRRSPRRGSGSRPRPAPAAGPPRRACRSPPRPRSRGRPGSRGPCRRPRPTRAGHQDRPVGRLEARGPRAPRRTSRR